MLFTQLIKANLETKTLGREIEYYNRLESTNTEATELLDGGAEEGTVVITDNQISGRGRWGRTWYSGPGKGLAFSVILKPEIEVSLAGLFPVTAGVAVVDALTRFQLEPGLKWPNDILIKDRKCGGILVESKFRGNIMASAIVGIGINVNEELTEFPDELQSVATSVAIEKGAPVQRELLLAWTLNAFESWYTRLKTGIQESIISAWQKRCAHLGKQVTFQYQDETTSGIFLGVAPNGSAIIERESGTLHLSSEEIFLMKQE